MDDNGAITYADGSALPSYGNARIWIKNTMEQTDPNWYGYQSIPYQATYSYVISPLSYDIRIVRNESHGPAFKKVIPDDEFNYITATMLPGEELKYTLILANIYKMGLQRLEFIIRKE